MLQSRRSLWLLLGLLAAIGPGCKSSDSPTAAAPAPAPPALMAVPASVTIAVGATQPVVVSGGKPPYAISAAPSAIASATLMNPDSANALINITGVTVASVSTAVTLKDSSPPPAKEVTVPIKVQ